MKAELVIYLISGRKEEITGTVAKTVCRDYEEKRQSKNGFLVFYYYGVRYYIPVNHIEMVQYREVSE